MICTKCKIDKPEEGFGWKSLSKEQRQYWCRECVSAERKKQYESYKSRGLQAAARRRAVERTKEIIDKAKDNPCTDCGMKFHPVCMDFDHIKEKTYNVSLMKGFGVEALKKEISKCELVCSNCHRIRTHKRRLAQSS